MNCVFERLDASKTALRLQPLNQAQPLGCGKIPERYLKEKDASEQCLECVQSQQRQSSPLLLTEYKTDNRDRLEFQTERYRIGRPQLICFCCAAIAWIFSWKSTATRLNALFLRCSSFSQSDGLITVRASIA